MGIYKPLCKDPELFSGPCYMPYRPTSRDIVVFTGGNQFVDMLCSERLSWTTPNAQGWCRINSCTGVYIPGSSDFGWNQWLFMSHSVVTHSGDSVHRWSTKQTGLRKWNLSLTNSAFQCYMLKFMYWDIRLTLTIIPFHDIKGDWRDIAIQPQESNSNKMQYEG